MSRFRASERSAGLLAALFAIFKEFFHYFLLLLRNLRFDFIEDRLIDGRDDENVNERTEGSTVARDLIGSRNVLVQKLIGNSFPDPVDIPVDFRVTDVRIDAFVITILRKRFVFISSPYQ